MALKKKTAKKKNTAKNPEAQALVAMRNSKLTPERRAQIASEAGKKSAEARRGKKPQATENGAKLLGYVQENRESIVTALACACAYYSEQVQRSQSDREREAAMNRLSKCLAMASEIGTLTALWRSDAQSLETSLEIIARAHGRVT